MWWTGGPRTCQECQCAARTKTYYTRAMLSIVESEAHCLQQTATPEFSQHRIEEQNHVVISKCDTISCYRLTPSARSTRLPLCGLKIFIVSSASAKAAHFERRAHIRFAPEFWDVASHPMDVARGSTRICRRGNCNDLNGASGCVDWPRSVAFHARSGTGTLSALPSDFERQTL